MNLKILESRRQQNVLILIQSKIMHQNICHLLFNVMDRPEVGVEMLKTNRNNVVEQSLGEVNLAVMVSLTMVMMKMV